MAPNRGGTLQRIVSLFAVILLASILIFATPNSFAAGKRHRTTAPATTTAATAGPTTPSAPTTEITDRGASSPRELLDDMATAYSQKAPLSTWMGFQPPANHDLAKEQMDLITKLGDKAHTVSQLVLTKIGKTESNMIATLEKGVQPGWLLAYQYDMYQIAPDGKVDSTRLTLTETDDKATATNGGSKIYMEKDNNKWYLSDGDATNTLANNLPMNKKMTDADLKMLDQIQQGVDAGTITKTNFIQKYSDLVNQSMQGIVP
jgi:hypothetical protein